MMFQTFRIIIVAYKEVNVIQSRNVTFLESSKNDLHQVFPTDSMVHYTHIAVLSMSKLDMCCQSSVWDRLRVLSSQL